MQTNMSALRPVRGITRAISVSRPPVIRWRSPNKVAFNGNSEVTINDPQANAGDTSPGRSPQPLQGLQMGRASLEAAKARQRPRRPDASHRHTGGAGMPTDPYWWVRLLHGKRFAANIGVSIEPAVEAGARQLVRRFSRRGPPSQAGGGTIRTPARSSDRPGPGRSAAPRHAGRRAGRWPRATGS
jgi:hypothetical protein